MYLECCITTVIMESTKFDYSTKNIPLPSESDYIRIYVRICIGMCIFISVVVFVFHVVSTSVFSELLLNSLQTLTIVFQFLVSCQYVPFHSHSRNGVLLIVAEVVFFFIHLFSGKCVESGNIFGFQNNNIYPFEFKFFFDLKKFFFFFLLFFFFARSFP